MRGLPWLDAVLGGREMGIEAVYEIEAARALIADLVAERDELRAALVELRFSLLAARTALVEFNEALSEVNQEARLALIAEADAVLEKVR